MICRPPSEEEVASRTPQVIKCDELTNGVTLTQNMNGKQYGRTYHFDQVFGPDTTQTDIYDGAISPIVQEVLNGFNCTIFAYGQTGTGKTHTMTGELAVIDSHADALPPGSGVIPRAVAQIFSSLEGNTNSTEYTVKCCFLELYNEEITDLLAMGTETPKIRIMEDRSGVVVQGLEEPHVKCAADIFALLETGNARRRTAETLLNKQSSRSHSVFIVTVSVREVLAEGEEVIRVGKLYLVDLAGSENVSRSGAVDQRAKEAGNINKSLLTLGRVITALVEGQGHVPYRDSKLTRLLRDSLGGRTKTCIIATIAPTVHCQEETLSTLDYAHRAKNIKNKPELNQKISKTTHLKELSSEIARLKAELLAQREKNGVYLPVSQYEEECAERERLAERAKDLEEAMTKVDEKIDGIKAELSEARIAIEERDFMLQAFEKAENSLSQHAYRITDTLKTAIGDVAQLFERVDAKNALEDANATVISNLNEDVQLKINALNAALQDAAEARSSQILSASSKLQELASSKVEGFQLLAKHMDTVNDNINGIQVAAENALNALKTENGSCVESLRGGHEHLVQQVREEAEKSEEDLKKACEALASSSKEEWKMFESIISSHRSALQKLHATISNLVLYVQQQFQKVQKEAGEVTTSIENAFMIQAKAAEEHASNHSTFTRQEKDKLFEQLRNLIDNFAEKSEHQVSKSAQEMKERCISDQQNLSSIMTDMNNEAITSLQKLSTHAEEIASEEASMAKDSEEKFSTMKAAMESTEFCGSAVINTASTGAGIILRSMNDCSKDFTASLKKSSKSFSSIAAKQKKLCDSSCDITYEAITKASGILQEKQEAQMGLLKDVEEQFGSVNDEISELITNHAEGLRQLNDTVCTALVNEFKLDAERESVPKRRKFVVSSCSDVDHLRAPSREVLAMQFKAPGTENTEEIMIQNDTRNCLEEAKIDDQSNETCEKTRGPLSPNKNFDNQILSDCLTSPSLKTVGQKRDRCEDNDDDRVGCESPSKIRAAFKKGEKRRTQKRQANIL